jgi:hypothetical protein
MATIQSLVDQDSFVIDGSVFNWTADKYFYKGHFYSDKPPILSLYGAIFYFFLKSFLNLSFYSYEKLTCYLVTLFTIGGLTCIGLIYFRKILVEIFGASQEWADVVTLITGAGTLILPYSTVLNNHIASGVLLLLGFYYLLKTAHHINNVIGAGIFTSLAGSVDFNCFLFVPFALIYFLIARSRKAGIIFFLSCLPVIGLFLGLNLYTSGSVIPPAMNQALWNYPGSAFNPQNLSGLAGHQNLSSLLFYAFHMILGNRGLLVYTPLLIFTILVLILIFKDPSFIYKKEYLYIFAASLGFILIYILRTVNYSGYAFGVRWFASLMLILCLPIVHLEQYFKESRVARRVFFLITLISFMIAIAGTYNPFTPDGLSDIDRYHVGPPNTLLINLKLIATEASIQDKLKLATCTAVIYVSFYKFFRRWERSQLSA